MMILDRIKSYVVDYCTFYLPAGGSQITTRPIRLSHWPRENECKTSTSDLLIRTGLKFRHAQNPRHINFYIQQTPSKALRPSSAMAFRPNSLRHLLRPQRMSAVRGPVVRTFKHSAPTSSATLQVVSARTEAQETPQ